MPKQLLANLRPGDLLISDYHLNGALTGLDVLQQARAPTSMGSAGYSLERRFAVDDARRENIHSALSFLE